MFYQSVVLKGTVCVISSEPPFKDGNSLFTTVPFKGLPDLVLIIFYNSKTDSVQFCFSTEGTNAFLLQKNKYEFFDENFSLRKNGLGKRFKGMD